MLTRIRCCFPIVLFVLLVGSTGNAQTSFIAFDSGHVRPIALSPDGSKLFAVNTSDNTLEIFDVGPGGLSFSASVPVGMEPVAVAGRSGKRRGRGLQRLRTLEEEDGSVGEPL